LPTRLAAYTGWEGAMSKKVVVHLDLEVLANASRAAHTLPQRPQPPPPVATHTWPPQPPGLVPLLPP